MQKQSSTKLLPGYIRPRMTRTSDYSNIFSRSLLRLRLIDGRLYLLGNVLELLNKSDCNIILSTRYNSGTLKIVYKTHACLLYIVLSVSLNCKNPFYPLHMANKVFILCIYKSNSHVFSVE